MLSRLQQLMDQRQDQQAVGARPDADPVVGDRRIAGAHRIDRNEARAALLQLGDADLQRIGIMVLGDAEHHEQFGAIPVRRAEFPERAADRHDAGRRHVDRAEAAMRGIVGRAELLRPEAGQRLRLVAAGEEGELLGVGLAHAVEPADRDAERLVPRNLLEFARAARTDALQRRIEPGRRVVLHDAGRTLGAQHAAIDGMVAVALDVADLAVLDMDVDAAAAGAHIACGLAHFVRDGRGQRDLRVGWHEQNDSLMRVLGEALAEMKCPAASFHAAGHKICLYISARRERRGAQSVAADRQLTTTMRVLPGPTSLTSA